MVSNYLPSLQVAGQGLQGDQPISIGPISDFQSKEIVVSKYPFIVPRLVDGTDFYTMVNDCIAVGGSVDGLNPDKTIPFFNVNSALTNHFIYVYLFAQIFDPTIPVESSLEFELVLSQIGNPNATSRFPASLAKFDNKQTSTKGGSLISMFSGGNVSGSLVLFIKDPFTDTRGTNATLEPLSTVLNPLRISGPFNKLSVDFLGLQNLTMFRLFVALNSTA